MVFTHAKNVTLAAFTSVLRKSGNMYQWFKRDSREKIEINSKNYSGKQPWLEAEGGSEKEVFMVKSSAIVYDALRS